MGHPRPLFCLFSLFFKQTLQLFKQMNVKNIHPVYSRDIWTHDHQKMGLIPWPLDQGSRPLSYFELHLKKPKQGLVVKGRFLIGKTMCSMYLINQTYFAYLFILHQKAYSIWFHCQTLSVSIGILKKLNWHTMLLKWDYSIA